MRLAGPIIVSRMGILVMITADTVMVGWYSGQELAYQGIGVAMIVPVLLSFMGMIMGTMVLTSNNFGAENYTECGRVWRFALPYAFVLGMIAFVISLFGEQLLTFSGQTAELSREGGIIMEANGYGLPGHLIFLASAFFLDGIRRPTPAMVIMILANVLNIFLNWMLIYGNLGFEADGAEGATWATTWSRWFLACGIVTYIWFMNDHEKFGVRLSPKGGWKAWAKLRNIGYAMGVSIGVESTAFATLNIYAGWLGTDALASYTIGLNVLAICFMIAIGLGSAASVRVGIAYGRRDWPDMQLAGWTGLGVTTGILAVVGVVLFLLSEPIAGFYSPDQNLLMTTAPLIFFIGFVLVFDGGQATMANVLRGRRDVWVPSMIQAFSFLGVLVPLAYVFAFKMGYGVPGLFYGIMIAGVISLVLLVLRFHWLGRTETELSLER
jgi:MATE family multidrug resistance protein